MAILAGALSPAPVKPPTGERTVPVLFNSVKVFAPALVIHTSPDASMAMALGRDKLLSVKFVPVATPLAAVNFVMLLFPLFVTQALPDTSIAISVGWLIPAIV